MKFIKTPIPDLKIIVPEPFQDERGKFSRIYCFNELKEIGHNKSLAQINHSITKQKGAIRGMHKGSVFDVAIDLRKGSPTFLKWHGVILSAENMKAFYVPEGFAHGFQTLEENCELLYFHTEFYSPKDEGAVKFDDPLIGIEWPLEVSDISDKDTKHKLLSEDFKGVSI